MFFSAATTAEQLLLHQLKATKLRSASTTLSATILRTWSTSTVGVGAIDTIDVSVISRSESICSGDGLWRGDELEPQMNGGRAKSEGLNGKSVIRKNLRHRGEGSVLRF